VLVDVLMSAITSGVFASVVSLSARARSASSTDRDLRAAVWPVALAAAPAAGLPLLGVPMATTAASAVVCSVLSAVWLPKTRRWTIAAHLTWVSAVTAGGAFLLYTETWTLSSHFGVAGTVGGVLFWLLEAAAYLLSLAHLPRESRPRSPLRRSAWLRSIRAVGSGPPLPRDRRLASGSGAAFE